MIINPGEIILDEALNICKEALKKGYDLIHKAHFKYDGWVGEIDFLIKDKSKKTKNGKWIYEVYDTKLSSVAKVDHITQISLYSEWIATQQDNELPDFMHLILNKRDKERKDSRIIRILCWLFNWWS